MKMGAYVVRRLLLMVPVLLGVTLVTFGIAWKANEGALYRAYLTDKMSTEQRDAIIHQYGFDRPWYEQYLSYVNRLLHGDLGVSHSQQDLPITEVFHQFFPATAELAIVGMLFAATVGLFMGVLAAVKKDKPIDHFTRFMSLSGVALPIFWLGLLLKFAFATPYLVELATEASLTSRFIVTTLIFAGAAALVLVVADAFEFRVRKRHWRLALGGAAAAALAVSLASPLALANMFESLPDLPLGGRFSDELVIDPEAHPSLIDGPTKFLLVDTALARDWVAFRDVAWHLVLPGVTLGYHSMAIIARMMRSSMLETLNQDYVRTARAKGISEAEVLRKHARRNALIPTTTVIGIAFGGLLGGAVLTETIFQWPGLGRWSTISITSADVNSILAFTLITTLIYVTINFVVDIVYAYLDPRVRLGGEAS